MSYTDGHTVTYGQMVIQRNTVRPSIIAYIHYIHTVIIYIHTYTCRYSYVQTKRNSLMIACIQTYILRNSFIQEFQ